MAEEVAKIRGEVPCAGAREFRDAKLAERYRAEFSLPCTESLAAGDEITIELLYRSGQIAVLGRGLVIAACPGGYQVRFTQISLGEVNLASENWDDTVPPTLFPGGPSTEPHTAIVTTYSTPERPAGSGQPPDSGPTPPPSAQGKRKKPTTNTGAVSGAPRRRRGNTTRAPVFVPAPRDTVIRPPAPQPARRPLQRQHLITGLVGAVLVIVGLTIVLVVKRAGGSEEEPTTAALASEKPTVAAELRESDRLLLHGQIGGAADDAVAHLRRAIELDPGSPEVQKRVSAYVDVFEGLAHGAAEQGFTAESLVHLDLVLSLDPEHAGAKALSQDLRGRVSPQ